MYKNPFVRKTEKDIGLPKLFYTDPHLLIKEINNGRLTVTGISKIDKQYVMIIAPLIPIPGKDKTITLHMNKSERDDMIEKLGGKTKVWHMILKFKQKQKEKQGYGYKSVKS